MKAQIKLAETIILKLENFLDVEHEAHKRKRANKTIKLLKELSLKGKKELKKLTESQDDLIFIIALFLWSENDRKKMDRLGGGMLLNAFDVHKHKLLIR